MSVMEGEGGRGVPLQRACGDDHSLAMVQDITDLVVCLSKIMCACERDSSH